MVKILPFFVIIFRLKPDQRVRYMSPELFLISHQINNTST